ncbi:sperm-associated antigen 1 isoform X1 [Pelobates cultripes]|nr:sperm-associated antigen 1 isoform X1 [Pelobates cultripes]
MSASDSVMDYGTTKRHAIPIDHLDYRFIEKCTDVKHLEKVLHVLRSGEEGHYPDLTLFCEKRIENLSPQSRALRKDKPPATAADFSLEDWQQIDIDLKNWLTDIKMKDQEQSAEPHNAQSLPPVRDYSSCPQNVKPKEKGKQEMNSKVPRDYRDWDRFDVEKEISKIEVNSKEEVPSKTVINSSTSEIKKTIDTAGLNQAQRSFIASREKDKGNEAFRSDDYKEAVAYYTRSISVLPTAAAYNNRAQAEIKLKNWHNALSDCERVLDLEAGNMKALLRRATVYKNLCNYHSAACDLKAILQQDPDNCTAKKVLIEVERLIEKETVSKGVRIHIEDIEGSDEEKPDVSSCKQEAGVTVGGGEAGEHTDMGNAQKKSSPKRNNQRDSDGQIPKQSKESAQNGVKKDLGNGQTARNLCRENGNQEGASEKANGHQDPNQNTKQPSQPVAPAARLKGEGNQLFKNGQFGEAAIKYTEAINLLTEAGSENAEELGVLYSNRAACQLKEGNCRQCIEDCNRALELQPFSMKPLLRRAMANESLERYREAYVDYKIVLQIDSGMQVANDSINRITRTLIDQDGSSWREKLPPIPSVPGSFHLQRQEGNITASNSVHPVENNQPGNVTGVSVEETFRTLKKEGNEYVQHGQYGEAVKKYTECLALNSEDCTIYTNRALCYLKLCQYEEARSDCECALQRDSSNIKALYRRAQAHKGLENYQECASDLQKTLSLDPKNPAVLALMNEITPCLHSGSQGKLRKKIEIEEVSEQEEESAKSIPAQESIPINSCPNGAYQNNISENTAAKPQITKPTNAYEFGQRMNEVKAAKDLGACAELLLSIDPKDLPLFLSNKLEGDILLLIAQSLAHNLLDQNPALVYQHLSHLIKAERFQMMLMLLNKNEKAEIQRLFTLLYENPCENVKTEDVRNLAKQYEL